VRVRAGENTIQFYYPQPLYFAMILVSWCTLAAVFAIPGLKPSRPDTQSSSD
jgi:hypothetical protein